MDSYLVNELMWIRQEDVVISGMSGRFPESNSVAEFTKNLYDGVDMVTEDDVQGPAGLFGRPLRAGKLKDIKHFDASFFGVHPKQTECMDPQARVLLEVVYEAIVDAGVNPVTIRGSNTGVFIGITANDSEEFWKDIDHFNSYGLTGCLRTMCANRISFAFDFKGPSYAIDAACGSSGYGLQQALTAIRTGQCDAAIVGGCNLLLNRMTSVQANELGMLSPEGMCKTFDESGNGMIRSEAVVALFLQKSSVAKRIYATVVHAKTNNDGAKEEGITFPSRKSQKELIEQVCKEVNINPAEVAYIEAHGTGTKAGDSQEVNAIVDTFCKGRSSPLLIGSVKSNMGHSEAAAGLCGIVKVLISMEKEIIPSNLHFQSPNKAIAGLNDGRLQVITKPWPFTGGYVAINCFGFGGTNSHALLKSNPKQKHPFINDDIPRLVCVSGRTKDGVDSMLNKIIEMPRDDEFIALLHGIHNQNIPGHKYRGFTIMNDRPTREISTYNEEARPVWFVFSGMGSQWNGMGRDLMKLKIFSQSIHKAAEILKQEGLDLYKTLESDDESLIDDAFISSLSISIIQAALIDILKVLGIDADGYLGHSIGELGCAYMDGSITFQQFVLSAYWRGRAIFEVETSKGAMAAVGLSWEETIKRVPSDIMVGCHNNINNVTVSGPVHSIRRFIKNLECEGIFAEEVASAGIAFHTKYVADIGLKMQNYLEKIIPNPKLRSSKWISSSIPKSDWDMPLAQSSSSQYFVNNLLSPVYFYEAVQHIPKNAIVVEVAPHTLLQPFLKRILGPNATILGLHQKNHPDNLEFMLSNLGRLYNVGGQPKLNHLFRSIEFPVSKGTPMIQSMLEWDHSIQWSVPDFSNIGKNKSVETIIEIDLRKDEQAFYLGHAIDRGILFPVTGYLTLAWQTFSKHHGKIYTDFPVVMENVKFLGTTTIPSEGSVKFSINIFIGSGEFEICESNSIVVKGFIKASADTTQEAIKLSQPYVSNGLSLNKRDIYKELRLRGYDYSGIFCGIISFDNYGEIDEGFCGKLDFNDNYVSFMDSMLQFKILGTHMNTRELYLPTTIQKLLINPLKQKQIVDSTIEAEGLRIFSYNDVDIVSCGGVEMRGIHLSLVPRRPQQVAKLEKYIFIPFENEKKNLSFSLQETLIIVLQIVVENNPQVSKLKLVEAGENKPVELLYASKFIEISESEPIISLDYIIASSNEKIAEQFDGKVVPKDICAGPVEHDCHLAVAADMVSNEIVLTNLSASVKAGGFILCIEESQAKETVAKKTYLSLIFKTSAENKIIYLFRKVVVSPISQFIPVFVDVYDWVEDVKTALALSEGEGKKVLLVSEGDETNGITGLINCLIKEPGGTNLRSIFIRDRNAPKFSLNAPVYATQLNKDLVHNVYKDGVFGTYRHLPLENLHEKLLDTEYAYIGNLVRGDLTNLNWIEGPLKYYRAERYPAHTLCTVYYAPVSFRDVLLASGKLSPNVFLEDTVGQNCILGQEFSGYDNQGQRLMGIVAAGSLSTTVLADPTFLWEIPDTWTLKEASTVPVAYGTAYYALIIKGQLKCGEFLLIHDGTNDISQAAISIALHMGCTVYTTVNSKEKRTFLMTNFPQLNDDDITNSHDIVFEQHIMKQTKGKGVDLILTSLAEENPPAFFGCLAKYGRFLKIGNGTELRNSSLEMSTKYTTHHDILMESLFDPTFSDIDKQHLVQLLKDGITNGVVKPLYATVFSVKDVEKAFRFLATGKIIGKTVVEVRAEEPHQIIKPSFKVVHAVPRTYMHPDKTYILIGGLGGFGLELGNWLVSRGATKILITSRTGLKTSYDILCVKKWEQKGVKVLISTTSCITVAETEKLLKEANSLGSVGGIFNLAVVLHDALMENLTPDDFVTVCKPKIKITKNLDIVSRKECPDLDYFVTFSSVTCGRGYAGQSNYGFANSVMEKICEARQAAGFPANAIQWGPIGDVGIFFEMCGNNDTEINGVVPQRIISCLDTIDNLLQQPYPVTASSVLAEKPKADGEASIGGLVDAAANILGFKDPKNINLTSTLVEIGMDSLMGTEIKQTMERNFSVTLNVSEIRNLTFEKLLELQSSQTARH